MNLKLHTVTPCLPTLAPWYKCNDHTKGVPVIMQEREGIPPMCSQIRIQVDGISKTSITCGFAATQLGGLVIKRPASADTTRLVQDSRQLVFKTRLDSLLDNAVDSKVEYNICKYSGGAVDRMRWSIPRSPLFLFGRCYPGFIPYTFKSIPRFSLRYYREEGGLSSGLIHAAAPLPALIMTVRRVFSWVPGGARVRQVRLKLRYQ